MQRDQLAALGQSLASIRAKVEHPFRVIKRQFGHIKVRCRGLKKNTAQLNTLFALANLSMARKKLDLLGGELIAACSLAQIGTIPMRSADSLQRIRAIL